MASFRYTGGYAGSLGDGRPVAPGDLVVLDPDGMLDPHNMMMAEEGTLILIEDAGKSANIDKANADTNKEVSQ